MGLMFGYLSNDFRLVRSAFHSLGGVVPVLEAGAKMVHWGLGFIESDQALLRKSFSKHVDGFDLAPMVSDLKTPALLGTASYAPFAHSGDDIPPYRFRGWLMAHDSPRESAIPEALEKSLPDYVRRNLNGRNRGEILMHTLMADIKRVTPYPSTDQTRDLTVRHIQRVRAAAREARLEIPPQQNYLLTDGRMMLATRVGAPVYYRAVKGIVDDPVMRNDPLFAGHRPTRVDHPNFKAVFFVTGLQTDLSGWTELADNRVAWVDKFYDVQTVDIG